MEILIREINKSSADELRIVTQRCMSAVLETIPEFAGDPAKARLQLPNFSFEQMSAMILNDFDDVAKQIIVALVDGAIVGQSLYSVKEDAERKKYGYCFSRYVAPQYRRHGIATALLRYSIDWFRSQKVAYILAQTHVSNIGIQRLFSRFNFERSGPVSGAWQYYALRKDLANDGQER